MNQDNEANGYHPRREVPVSLRHPKPYSDAAISDQQPQTSLRDRLGHLAGADAAGADLHPTDGAIDLGANPLEVRLEGAAHLAGDLGTDSAEVLGLTAQADLVPELCRFSTEFAYASHGCLVPERRPIVPAALPRESSTEESDAHEYRDL